MPGATEPKYDPETMATVIRDCEGNIQAVARHLQCSPATVYRYMDRHELVDAAVQEARQQTYAEAVDNVVEAMKGAEDVDIDQQWATKRILETYGETVADGLTWTEKTRHERIESLGINILPPEDDRQIRDSTSQQLQNGEIRQLEAPEE